MHGASTFCFALGSLIAHVIAGIQKTAKLCRLILNICNMWFHIVVTEGQSVYSLVHGRFCIRVTANVNDPAFIIRQMLSLCRLIVDCCNPIWNRLRSVWERKCRGVARGNDIVDFISRKPYSLFHGFTSILQPIDIIGWSGSFRPRSSHKLYHSAKTRNQLDNVPSYAVAWAGGFSASGVVAAWRLLRARATTWLKRRESSSTVGVAVPCRQESSVAGLTPTSWARRLAGVFESSRAPEMSKIPLFSDFPLTFEESLINSSLIKSPFFCESHSKKPTSSSLSRQDAPKGRLPDRLCVRFG